MICVSLQGHCSVNMSISSSGSSGMPMVVYVLLVLQVRSLIFLAVAG